MLNSRKVRLYLLYSILSLLLIPLLASFFLLNEIFDHITGLVANESIKTMLKESQNDLKNLRETYPQQAQEYKVRFDKISNELLVYEDYNAIRKALRKTYLTYYFILIIIVILLALSAAAVLSRQVSKAYTTLLTKDIEKERRFQQLQYLQRWKEVADNIAHEIKNALTPIEMKTNSLAFELENSDNKVVNPKIQDAREIIQLELTKLKQLVFYFSSFAKSPEPSMKATNLSEHAEKFVRQYADTWPEAKIVINNKYGSDDLIVDLDGVLFNQVLINLINNAVEANQCQQSVGITITLATEGLIEAALTVENTGATIDANLTQKLFEIRYSSRGSQHNMGLGLTIAKKIILEHNGDIVNLPREQGAAFSIHLPLLKVQNG